MSKLNWYYDETTKTSGYEEMIAGQSFILLRQGTDEIHIPVQAWRKMMTAWQKNKWDPKFDDLSVTDECFTVDN